MRFVIQRVTSASVEADGKVCGTIGTGFLVLIGISAHDDEASADKMTSKLLGLRIFSDAQDKTNLNLDAVGGSLLLVSQFTLYADCRRGNRPSFTAAGAPDDANRLYEYIVSSCRGKLGASRVETGSFERPVHEPRTKNCFLARPALSLDETARYLAGSVHLFFVVA